jgi:hypothetical protein
VVYVVLCGIVAETALINTRAAFSIEQDLYGLVVVSVYLCICVCC